MDILFKSAATGVNETINYDEFKDRIREGTIVALDKVCDRILTDDEWRTVDTLNLFRRLSPSTRGAWLLQRERARKEYERREEEARAHLEREQRLAERFFRLEESPDHDFISQFHDYLIRCEEPPLTEYETAVRFTYLNSWGPAFFVRISNRSGAWELSYKAGRTKRCGPLPNDVDVQHILAMADSVGLHKMPRQSETVCCDGSDWGLEYVRNGDCTMRHRHEPAMAIVDRGLVNFVALGRCLAMLCGLESALDELGELGSKRDITPM